VASPAAPNHGGSGKLEVGTMAASSAALELDDLTQLGLLAGSARLREAAAGMGLPSVASSGPGHRGKAASSIIAARHDAVLAGLATGRIVRAEKRCNQFGHVTYKCLLEDAHTRSQ
jgi:hypothetical protein